MTFKLSAQRLKDVASFLDGLAELEVATGVRLTHYEPVLVTTDNGQGVEVAVWVENDPAGEGVRYVLDERCPS